MLCRLKSVGCVVLLAAVIAAPSTADAGPSGGPGDSPETDILDMYYDYQLWIAWDVTRYYVTATDPYGNTTEEGFNSAEDAYDWAAWLFFHDFVNVDIVERKEMSDWVLSKTLDTRAEAENWKAFAEAVGYYAKIVPVSAFASKRVLRP